MQDDDLDTLMAAKREQLIKQRDEAQAALNAAIAKLRGVDGYYASEDDTFLTTTLRQAREYKVGMMIAHHELSVLSTKTQSAIMTNTSIKFVRAAGHDDVSKMSREMETTAAFIKDQGIGQFAVFLRNGTMRKALSVTIPPHPMENAPTMTDQEYEQMRQLNRERYCITQQPPQEEAVAAQNKYATEVVPTTIPQQPRHGGATEGINVDNSIPIPSRPNEIV